jgi:plastocyanin
VGRIRLVVAAVLAAVAVNAPADALAGTVAVSVKDFFYSPTPLKLRLGDVVVWQNNSPATPHTATSDGVVDGTGISGLGLWNTGTVNAGKPSNGEPFNWAGKFKYHCSFHATSFGMRGSVKVLPAASPKSGTTATMFQLTWAEAAPPPGLVFDVLLKRPGQASVSLTGASGTTDLSATFTPDAGPGTYSFRARLRDPAGGLKSGYSPARRITVS